MVTIKERRQQWKVRKANWTEWKTSLAPLRYEGIVDSDYSSFTKSINEACEKTLKKTSRTINLRYYTPWWSEECSEIVRDKHQARNRLNKYPTVENLINFKRLEAMAKKITRKAKRESFKKYCSTLNYETPISEIWNKIGAFQKKYKTENISPFITPHEICTDPQKKSNLLAAQYEKNFNCQAHKMNSTSLLLPLTMALMSENEEGYNSPINFGELVRAISGLKNSSPGHDLIHNQMLKNLPKTYLEFLLKIFNN